ncbi:insoluble domain protein [Rhodococcus sp. NPDC003318]|uniref:insoluble domain protein n=1 Tax=Rhodococcus sp. NPDC003318 TaxID=3364503 RepID=UPI0036C80DF6
MNHDIHTGNRAARRSSGGRHRKVQRQATTALVAAAAVAAGLALVPSAGAAPTQGGTTGGGTQGGTVGGAAQGGTTTAPAPAPAYVPEAPAQPTTWVETPQTYAPENIEWRAMPNYDYEIETYVAPEYTYIAPVPVETLHLPVAVTPTAPIISPRNKIRFGDSLFEQPNWVSDSDAERTNNTSAIFEAQVTDFWRSIGVETTRAERLAASQVAGGVTGAIGGATAAGVPAALVGGLIGGTIGGVQGAYLGTVIPTPIPGLPVVTSGAAGTAGGAAIGAAVAGVPAAAVGGVAGGAAGVAAATNFGAGDLTEPREVAVDDVEHDAIVEQTAETLADWENSGPVGASAADAVQTVAHAAPVVDQQVRDFITAQPGGQQVVEQVDMALNDFFTTATPGLTANLISTAVGDGIAQYRN